MNRIPFCLSLFIIVFAAGCNFIGNGIAKSNKLTFESPEYIDIEGDWRTEIICNAKENSCEVVLDENLLDRYKIRSGKNLRISLDRGIQPMVSPVLRINLTAPFKEFSMEGNTICNIRNFKSATPLEIDISEYAVCVFDNCSMAEVEAEVSEHGKLSFKGTIEYLTAEIHDRAVLEADKVEKFYLECSDNSRCCVKSCNEAEVDAEDNAKVEFKAVKQIEYEADDNAGVEYPLIIPESLKKK